jgi:hypothetical protein
MMGKLKVEIQEGRLALHRPGKNRAVRAKDLGRQMDQK